MRNMIATGIRAILGHFGYDVVRRHSGQAPALPADLDAQAAQIIRQVRPYTMTSPERLFALIQAVRYVSAAGIPGDIVECGVWRGGSMMAAALTLVERRDAARQLYLFDTFDGMSAPTDKDVAIDGESARKLLATQRKDDPASAWCYATIDDVNANMTSTGYDSGLVHYVKGKVEETIPASAPDRIAVLRLDTDWYESTRHEMEHLFPRLVPGGVLIVDDYGHWAGCRQAIDEYLQKQRIDILLNRVDYTGRMAVKRA